jgi:hypothetical protein
MVKSGLPTIFLLTVTRSLVVRPMLTDDKEVNDLIEEIESLNLDEIMRTSTTNMAFASEHAKKKHC